MMSNKNFDIKKGNYVVPKIGSVDAHAEVSDETAYAIYQLPRKQFPWISLTKNGLAFLKKKKLKAEEVARLILQAQSPEEVELLSELSDAKAPARVRETKLKALKVE